MKQINIKPQLLLPPKITFACVYYHTHFKHKNHSSFALLSLSRKKNCKAAWNFRLKFWLCQQHFLRNILISSSLKSEKFVAWQNSNLEWWSMLVHECQTFFSILILFIYLFIYLFICLFVCLFVCSFIYLFIYSVLHTINHFSFSFLNIIASFFTRKI